ncbi:MAG: hypothetical protein JST89_02830 [Cyanobacteria bacterium SZAS-4]|nr:hypothetical protein [Cyanobacteria bacterium SZAS-4]
MSGSSRKDVKYQPEGSHEEAALVFSSELNQARLGELKEQLKIEPQALEPRLLLMGHFLREQYTAKGRKKISAALSYGEHIQAMVAHHPRHMFHATLSGFSEDKHFLETKSQWENQVRINPNDVTVLRHAARFNWIADPWCCAKLLQRASKLDYSNDLFPAQLCEVYTQLFHNSDVSSRDKFAKLAIKELKTAIARYESLGKHEERALYTYKHDMQAEKVAAIAIACEFFSEAREIAQLVLNRTDNLQLSEVLPHVELGEAYGMIFSNNKGHAILGQIAIAEGNRANAIKHFKKLLAVEPYDHVEANFATSLLESGEQKAVIQYLECVRELFANRVKAGKPNFKQSEETERSHKYAASMVRKLNLWIRKIEKGQTPRISWS